MDGLSLDVGILGPYEKGWLKERVSDRTFRLNVSAVREDASLRGLINGAQVSPLFFNVAPSSVIFPAYLKADMDAQCGAASAVRLVNAEGAQTSDILRMRKPSSHHNSDAQAREVREAT